MGRAPSLLSMVSVTSARPSGAREVVPAKTTSSILPPRRDLAPCSPMTQDKASTMLDLPEPFGPTTQVMPDSRRSVVAEANDLKPRRVRLFRYTKPSSPLIDRAPRHLTFPGHATPGTRPQRVPERAAAGRKAFPRIGGASPGAGTVTNGTSGVCLRSCGHPIAY